MVLIAVTVFMGLICFVIGYLVANKQMVEILGGYDPAKVADQAGLAKWVGANLFLMGVLAFASAGLMTAVPEGRVILFLVYVLGLLPLLCGRIVLGNRKYMAR